MVETGNTAEQLQFDEQAEQQEKMDQQEKSRNYLISKFLHEKYDQKHWGTVK